MHVGNDHGEVGKQQKIQGDVDDAEGYQRLVDQALTTENRNPRYHADNIGGPEGNCAHQEERNLPQKGPDMKNEKI